MYIYISSTYTRFKSKSHNHQARQLFPTWKNLFKETDSVNNNAPGRSISFEQMLVR